MTESVVQETAEGAVLIVHVQPKAARTGHGGLHGGALKIRVAAPPVGGAANDEVCRYLAACLGIPKTSVVLIAGHGSRRKRILLTGTPASQVRKVFALSDGVRRESSR